MSNSKSLKKNVAFSLIKQVLKVAFPIITFPYVSRILLEDNLGKYNFGLSIISYFSIFAALGINSYAIREGSRIRTEKDKIHKFSSEIFTINLLSTALAYISLLMLVITWPKLHSYKILLLIQSLTIVAGTFGVDWINSIFEDFEYMTKRYVFVKLISLVLIFLCIRNPQDYIFYAAINSGIEILASIMNIIYVRKYVHIKITTDIHLNMHFWPMLILFANALAVTIYVNSDITMLGVFRSESEVGIYGVASKMYQVSKNLINAITIVTIPRVAALLGQYDYKKYNSLLIKTIKTIVTFMFPLITGMFMLSKEAVLFLGGNTYLEGEVAFKFLTMALIPVALGSVFFDCVLIVNRKEKMCLFATVISALINVLLNLLLIPSIGINGAAISTFIAEALCCVLVIKFSKGFHSIPFKLDKDLFSVLVGSVGIFIICIVSRSMFSEMLSITVSVFLSIIVYSGIMIVFQNSVIISLIDSVGRKLLK